MKRGRSTGTPTKAQIERFEAIHRLGCVACRMRGLVRPTEVHHMTIGGRHGQKRRGHDETIGLCEYHHRGVFPEGWGKEQTLSRLGPSYAREPRRFREVFGQDDALLQNQNDLIARLGAEAA
jgi:hypothetical protein